ncbi:multidrug transporter [Anopheles sinensis]|uniref:Multidrug transporter n=1 Tax=Anopheles sinensis TaxID=74873 RepID=A0A084VP23_ANOSI|nr:multidrug transporter [Anopheles sinensis]
MARACRAPKNLVLVILAHLHTLQLVLIDEGANGVAQLVPRSPRNSASYTLICAWFFHLQCDKNSIAVALFRLTPFTFGSSSYATYGSIPCERDYAIKHFDSIPAALVLGNSRPGKEEKHALDLSSRHLGPRFITCRARMQ